MDGVEIIYDARYPDDDPVRVVWSPTLAGAGLTRMEPPTLDVSRLPGASVVASSGVTRGELTAQLGCVRGPSDRWAPGLEDVLFEKATWFVLRTFAMEGVPLRGEDGRDTRDGTLSRAYVGERDGRSIRLVHSLGFVGEDRDVLLCTVACLEGPSATTSCGPVTDSFAINGGVQTPPAPHVALRLVFAGIEHPKTALLVMFVLFLVASALVLRRRRRIRLA